MVDRLVIPSKTNSFFLFGARGTGKSTLLRTHFPQDQALWIDLLDPEQEARFQTKPGLLVEVLAQASMKKHPEEKTWVVIDEVQKIPELLDVVHSEIEKGRFLFALSGSSARKLKRGAANLLAGRAFTYSIFPLTYQELQNQFSLDFVLSWGSLPKVFDYASDSDRSDFLRAYANTYLREEIQAEQIVRKIAPFRAFLEVAAQSTGKILNFSKIARDIGSDPVSVQSYYEILEDTLLGILLKPFHSSIRKRQRKNPKFYFFDLGVQRALSRMLTVPIQPHTYGYGNAFEQFIIAEIIRLSSYHKNDWDFSYLRTKDDAEIDLIIDRPGMPQALIEIKSSTRINEADLGSFPKIARDVPGAESFCFSLDPLAQKVAGISCVPWQQGMKEIGL